MMRFFYRFIIGSMVAFPCYALEGAGGNCIQKPITCVTDILGPPQARQGYEEILEYSELKKYGPYFHNTPLGDTRRSLAVANPDLSPMQGSANYFYTQPVITPEHGPAFRFGCTIDFTVLENKNRITSIVYRCGSVPECISADYTPTLAKLRKGDVPRACKLPVDRNSEHE
jgi:hypothetical protein